jgi:site-specific recombinase XerD
MEFEKFLAQNNLSPNTIASYLMAVTQFFEKFGKLNKTHLLAYKTHLTERYKPQTVNVKILAINKWLDFIGKHELKLKSVKIQQRTFLDNVISDADYKYFKNKLRCAGKMNWYFVVRFLAATGARVSELVQIKIEHVEAGFIDIYGKGCKVRRIYIPKLLRDETLKYLATTNQVSGFLFLNKLGVKITTRGVADRLKAYAKKFRLSEDVVYPHSFRHLFAKNFLAKHNDISLLADLMGHESIETTRIYLRKTANEQRALVDSVITW